MAPQGLKTEVDVGGDGVFLICRLLVECQPTFKASLQSFNDKKIFVFFLSLYTKREEKLFPQVLNGLHHCEQLSFVIKLLRI